MPPNRVILLMAGVGAMPAAASCGDEVIVDGASSSSDASGTASGTVSGNNGPAPSSVVGLVNTFAPANSGAGASGPGSAAGGADAGDGGGGNG